MFEAANGGTLFLDEIGDMAPMTQTKLLRVLQENQVTPVGSSESRPVDVRIISATSKHLLDEIARGTFRGDLYHRINVLAIAVPSLMARREDIAELAEHFLRLASVENGVKPKRLSINAVELLKKLAWKGNVRELRNSMERVAVLITSDLVEAKNIADLVGNLDEQNETEDTTLPLREARNRFERQYILYRLSANSGNLGKTAQDLGIERTNLYRKMKQLGIQPTKARG
jgi:two-component system nitrogen regulation response regulator NtrX